MSFNEVMFFMIFLYKMGIREGRTMDYPFVVHSQRMRDSTTRELAGNSRLKPVWASGTMTIYTFHLFWPVG